MEQQTKESLRRILPERMIQIGKKYLLKKKFLKKRRFLSFELHIADHCNLKCKGCIHFSPLAEEKFLDTDIFQRDCQRIAELTDNNRLGKIRLMGGEPLLHHK